jgi:acetoin utilization protein AcuB
VTRAIDVMTERPVVISPQTSAATAARLLEELEIRHLPVVEDGELVGMISDRDLRGAMVASDGGRVPRAAPVSDLMNSDVMHALADDELTSIAELMVDQRIGAVPIVDERGLLVGIVSYVDVLRSLIADRDERADRD